MSTSKPHIIFVPGAWHSPSGFSEVMKHLESAGYTTKGINLASVGASTPLSDFTPDVEAIASEISSSTASGNDVMVVMHSYGGLPGNEACRGFLEPSESHKGVVSHLFFCCAFALPEGVSLLDVLGGKPLPWFNLSEDEKTVMPATPVETFYGDVEDAQKWVEELKPHSYEVFKSKVTFPAWKHLGDGKSTYLLCEKDEAIPIANQKGLVESSGIQFRTESLDASHSPFLSMPLEMANAIRRAAGEKV